MSGKSDGISVIIGGHTWVATVSEPESPWYRNQKHVENPRAIWRAINSTQATTSAGEGLTGASKVLPVVKVQGGTVSIVDFTLHGYARVNNGDYFEIQVGSNFAGDLVVNNVLWAITPLDTLMYI